MKFETYVHKIVLDHQPNFHKDPCKDARARGVNARTHVKKFVCPFVGLHCGCVHPLWKYVCPLVGFPCGCVPPPLWKYVGAFVGLHCGCVPPSVCPFNWKTIFVGSLHAACSALWHFFYLGGLRPVSCPTGHFVFPHGNVSRFNKKLSTWKLTPFTINL